MSAPSVRPLQELRIADAPRVGGKAAGLGELIAAGALVPEGVVLAAENGHGEKERGLVAAAVADSLPAGRYAVRSSGLAEDGAEHSFAGMFETVLDVEREDLAPAIERVLASAGSTRAAGYAEAGPSRMSLIV